jgi:methylase of polypeptide subunit release factors
MLHTASRSDAQRFLEFLAASDYTEQGFRRRPALQQLPSRHAGNLPWLLETTAEPTPFNLLTRLFLFGMRLPCAALRGVIPDSHIAFLVETGMASLDGPDLIPQVMLTSTENFVIAADPIYRMQPEPAPDIILWPNQSTRVMQNFALREPSRATLDFGAGCGVVAVLASPFSERVVATDINTRTAEFTPFNAWLNNLSNIETLIGDAFEPVAGRTFDRILANPPFFIIPSTGVLYCENPMELDGFCRRVAREGAALLNEGGFLQMTLEWVQIEGQPWQERVDEWLDDTGCDAWMLRTYNAPAAAYAHERCSNLYADSPEAATAKYRGCVDYYRSRNVEEVHGGLLVMRRRSGANWLRFEEGRLDPGTRFDHLVRDIFDTQDVLSAHPSDPELLLLRPRLSPDTTLKQSLSVEDARWVSQSFNLALANGMPSSLAVESQIADFLVRCDGTRTLREHARTLANAVHAPLEQVSQQCCAVVRRLAERRFLTFTRSAAPAKTAAPAQG